MQWMDDDAIFTDMAFEVPLDKYRDHNLVVTGSYEKVSAVHEKLRIHCES